MKVIWLWMKGGYRWFRPGHCSMCEQWSLVFLSGDADAGLCEPCWLGCK